MKNRELLYKTAKLSYLNIDTKEENTLTREFDILLDFINIINDSDIIYDIEKDEKKSCTLREDEKNDSLKPEEVVKNTKSVVDKLNIY